MNYIWKWQLVDKGCKELSVDDYDEENISKLKYVNNYLSPSVYHAKCGWDRVEYKVFQDLYENKIEYAVLCVDNSGRCYNVTGNSFGAIAETIWNGVYR